MKTEMNTALRDAATTIATAQFGEGITLTDEVRHSRREAGRWNTQISDDNVLARIGAPVRISLRENAKGDMVVVALLDLSTKGDRKGAQARAERLRSQGKRDDAEQALAEVRDVEVYDRDDVEFQIKRLGQLLRVRKVLTNKGKTVLFSMQGRRLEVIGDRTIVGAANGGRALYVRPAGGNRMPVKNIGHAVAKVFEAEKVAKARRAAAQATEAVKAAAVAETTPETTPEAPAKETVKVGPAAVEVDGEFPLVDMASLAYWGI
jgi:hypothetical protein